MALRISTGSGATLATDIIGGEHLQRISGLSLFPSSSFIGLATVVQANALPAGANFIGLASVKGTVNVSGGSIFVDWNSGATVAVSSLPNVTVGSALPAGDNNIGNVDLASAVPSGTNYIGLASVNIGGTLPPLTTGSNFVGLVTTVPGTVTPVSDNNGSLTVDFTSGATVAVSNLPTVTVNSHDVTNAGTFAVQAQQSGAWTVGLNHLVSLASGTFVSLNTGTNHIGSVSIYGNITANTGMTTLFPGPNFIGLVTTVPGAVTPVNDNGGSLTVDFVSGATVAVATLPTVTVNAHDVTNAGTFAVQAAQTGNWNVGVTGLISLASGTEIRSLATITNFPAVQTVALNHLVSLASGTFVSLNAGTNHIGSVSIFGTVTSNTGMTTLFPGPNFIGLVTAVPGSAFPVTDNSGSLTVDWISGATVAVASLPNVTIGSALPAGTNYIGLVSVSGSLAINSGATVNVMNFPATQAVTQSGTWDEVGIHDSGNSITVDGTVTANLSATDNTVLDNIDTSTAGILADTAAIQTAVETIDNAISGNEMQVDVLTLPSLPAGTNYIGLVSVSGSLAINSGATVNVMNFPATQAVSNAGTFAVQNDAAIPTGANYIGLATVVVGNTVTVGSHAVTNAGTFLVQNNAATPTGANFIGLVTVANRLESLVTLYPRTDYIGLVSVSGNVNATQSGTWNVVNSAGTNFMGLVSVQGNVNLNTGANFIGLATVVQSNQPALTAGSAFIGLATVIPAYVSNYTSFATIYSAAGSASLLVPPSGQRWVLKDLIIGALGRNEVKVLSGAQELIPYIALATTGGYISNFGDTGLRAKAVDQAFVVNLNSAATISVMANVRFE